MNGALKLNMIHGKMAINFSSGSRNTSNSKGSQPFATELLKVYQEKNLNSNVAVL